MGKINIKKLQEGGGMPQQAEPQMAAPQEQDPMEMLLQAAYQAVQTGDGEMALEVCAALVQMATGGAGAPEELGAPQGQPVFKKGGKLAGKKCPKCGKIHAGKC